MKKEIEFKKSNLYLVGKSKDANGNTVIKLKFPNKRAFSIQTNGNLPETHRIVSRLSGGIKGFAKATEEELETIENEVLEYLQKHGSALQKRELKRYFKQGGSITKSEYEQALRDYDKHGSHLEDAIEDGNESDIKKHRELMEDAESIIHRYERKYADGGQIESDIAKLEKLLKMTDEELKGKFSNGGFQVSDEKIKEIKEKAKKKIEELKHELHESKETKEEENKEDENNYYIINENSKYQLHFEPNFYKNLDENIKRDIKKYFLFSRAKKTWISKAKEGGYAPKSIINKIGLELKGKSKKLTFSEEIEQKKNRAEYRLENYSIKKEKAEAKAESLQSEFNKLRKDMSWLTQPIILGHKGSESFGRSKQRVIDKYEKGFEEYDKAKYYETKKQLAEDSLKDLKLKDIKYLDSKIKESETSIRKISGWIEDYQEKLKQTEDLERKEKYEDAIRDGIDRLTYNYDKLAYFKLAKEKLKEGAKKSGDVVFDLEESKKLSKYIKKFFKEKENLNVKVSTSKSYISVYMPKNENVVKVVKSIAIFKYPEYKDSFENGERDSIGNISNSYISLNPKEWYEYMKTKGFDFYFSEDSEKDKVDIHLKEETEKPKVANEKETSSWKDKFAELKKKKEFKGKVKNETKPVSGTKSRNIKRDLDTQALPKGKRVSKSGKSYYEYRANRSDISSKDKFEKGGEVKSNDWAINLNW